MQNIVGKRIFQVNVTPTVSTSPAYSANDQVGGIQTVSLPTNVTFTSVRINQVQVADASSQAAALNLYFFSSLPTVASSDNAALNISVAQLANCKLINTIAAASYLTSANAKIGRTALTDIGTAFVPSVPGAFYVVAQTTGTPTYATLTALVFTYVIELHF